MGVPLGTSFDVAEASPVDSRMTWTGSAGNLNQIAANGANRYPGLITYVSNDKNLYVYQGNNAWEKIVTNNVDSVTFFGGTSIDQSFHGQVIYVNSVDPVTLDLIGNINNYPEGYNVTIVQEGLGSITINTLIPLTQIANRLNATKTAGKYSIASLLRMRNSNLFLLYGDLV
jgi:hypothetical protein